MIISNIGLWVDMCGCPNRCRHCWLGVTPNGNLSVEDIRFAADEFRPFTKSLEIFDHLREPDFSDNYKELWEITKELSDKKTPHFENISYWRAVRDNDYIPWLYSQGVRAAQLTIFGNEETTDFFVGRNGAFNEILQTIDLLLRNKIAPRIQMFIYNRNIEQLLYVQNLIEDLDLEKRCNDIGKEFAFFFHQGSCGGENEQFYDDWITLENINKIPKKLIDYTMKHFGVSNIMDVLGEPEKDLYAQLINDCAVFDSIVTDSPWLFVDKDFNVYPNYETPAEFWCLGNIKRDGAETILSNFIGNKSKAQSIMTTVPVCEMVKKHGNSKSTRLFEKNDYKNYILNKYCRTD